MVGVFATGAAVVLRGRSWLGRTLREVRARVEVKTGAAGTKAISSILGRLANRMLGWGERSDEAVRGEMTDEIMMRSVGMDWSLKL